MVKGLEDKIVNTIVFVILTFVGMVTLFPLLYVVSMSVTPMSEVLKNGGYIVLPRNITFDAYRQLLLDPSIPRAFLVTVFVTVVGTIINMILTVLMAYPLSRKSLPFRSFILLFIAFTILFSGGLIPLYLTVKATGLLDSIWVLILPGAIGAFYVLIMKSFFEQLPEEIFESARIDGAKELRVLLQIVIPLSVPSLLTISLFYIVGHWNGFFQAIMFITDRELYPIQVIVRNILMRSQNVTENADAPIPTESVQMAAVVIASLPVIVIYPFIQKYFAQGMLIGSIKG
ncbi:carbohydrate ABC transporter permease [Paenibacillus sp. PAMC21692]|uniref:carbohydrate ABC transporter permease n=1 Tax=Paenibacillus sp. PAMC21692 TaxID=2762320 RepID=UPI00164DD666|nr:carbohydrate ABC transporter permease [Paenibacillus sp. PAMC21692]QNK60224.1 carbohydrate ABC transporter permease [Paenibacillus sp. PAMC21692]